MKLRSAMLACLAGAVVLLGSCKDGNIYATIHDEVEEEDLSLPNEIIVFDVAKIGARYYAAAGMLWTVADTATEWDTGKTIPSPGAGQLCTALVASPFGSADTLFAGFISGAGSVGLFESNATPMPAAPPVPSTVVWTAVADADVAAAQIALLKVVDHPTEKLAVVRSMQPSAGAHFQFSIVTTSDGSGFSELPFGASRSSADAEKQINDVLYSTTVGAWFATEGDALYSDLASPGTLQRVVGIDSLTTAGEVLFGLFEYDGRIFVSSWDGTEEAECAIYHSTDGSAWTRIAVPQEGNGVHPPLTRFAGPLGTTDKLLVGSDGYGYYRLDLAQSEPLTRFATTTSDLYPAAVRKFYRDAAQSRIFACTALSGLWRGSVSADGTIAWNQE